jgi:hypothetical protein
MRSIFRTFAITAASMLAITGFAHANDAQSETDSLIPTMDEIGSSLAAMMGETSVNGWAAGSYNYNFEGFENSAGTTNNANPSHATSNSFAVDQVQISLNNEATEDSRGGFNVDYEWGTVNGAGAGGALYTASVSYLAPIGTGINFDLGLIPTLVGKEVNQTNMNFNVTRGAVWALQPVTHTGAIASINLTEDISASFGVLNDQGGASGAAGRAAIGDSNNEKAITGQLGWTGEDVSASFQFVWGETAIDGVDSGTYDVILDYSGMENVAMYVNYSLISVDGPGGGGDGEIHGISAAARMAINEDCGIALRAEAVLVDPELEALGDDMYTVTVTGDHKLTSNLTAKAEVRFDISPDDDLRDNNGAKGEDFSALVLAQLVYEF